MTNRIRIVADETWYKWISGLASLKAPEESWAAAADIMFDYSQEYVHVITGNLKASGRVETHADAGSVVAAVVYGGGVVDYSLTEERRGGSHAYLTRAWQSTEEVFQGALGEAVDEMWESMI